MTALLLTVVNSFTIADVMQRIVFTGEGIERMPKKHAGLHIKLFFRKPDQTELALPKHTAEGIQWPAAHRKPFARTYSVVAFDHDTRQLTVDFVLHEAAGPASDFARSAKPGDVIGFAGPGPAELINEQCSGAVLFGDLSALPAISAIAESLAPAKLNKVFLELPSNADIEALIAFYFPSTHTAVEVYRSILTDKADSLNRIAEYLLAQPMAETSVVLAGEHNSVVYLKEPLRAAGWPKENLYAVPYWRHTLTEESYHQQRHHVMDH